MADWIWRFLADAGYQPHGYCLLWRPDVFWTHVISDAAIALAYLSIPVALVSLARRRRDLRYSWLLHLFGAFIVACGVTHLFGVWTMWIPSYGAEAVAKAATAAVSVATATVLWPLMPQLVAIPSRRELEETNARLATEVETRRIAEARLAALAGSLERRVAERTAELERANAELTAAMGQRRALLDTMIEGVAGYGRGGEPIYANAACRRILGLGPEQAPDIAALVAEGRLRRVDGAPIPRREAPDLRALGGATLSGEELRVTRGPEAGDAVCRVSGAPIPGPDGQPAGAVLTLADVTEEKENEERRKLLTAELDHRVRNMLATIVAMIQITSRQAESKEALREALLGRVEAMTRTHGLLTQNGWRGASLRRIVADETAPYAALERLKVGGGGDAILPPKDATDLALVIHELATNAAKHGAWSGPRGRVEIAWRIEVGPEPCVRLTWREVDGPPVAPATRRGFGGAIIRSAFGRGDHGGVDHRLEPEGAICEIRVPLRAGGADGAVAAAQAGPSARPQGAGGVSGRRVLVVEDEPLLRLETAATLDAAGAVVVGPASTLAEALAILDTTTVDGAILDVNLAGESADAVAERLDRAGKPYLFVTGYRELGAIAASRQDRPRLQKPVRGEELVAALATLIEEREGPRPTPTLKLVKGGDG